MKHEEDVPNSVFCGYIPDVVNHRYRYVIEVDGGVHQRPSVRSKDAFKDKVFKKKEYEVFRIDAYNHEQFGTLVDLVSSRRESHEKSLRPRTILRRLT